MGLILSFMKMSKRKIHFKTNIHIWVTDILKFDEAFVYILKVLSVFKNSRYAYSPLQMHETFPTLGNEKEQ